MTNVKFHLGDIISNHVMPHEHFYVTGVPTKGRALYILYPIYSRANDFAQFQEYSTAYVEDHWVLITDVLRDS